MIDKRDIEAAVSANILTPSQAQAFAEFIDARYGGSETEDVRFVRGFHDVFITLGTAAMLGGVAFAGKLVGSPGLLSVTCLIVSWGLAEFLTRKRRLLLPSNLLAVSVGLSGAALGWFGAAAQLGQYHGALPLVSAACGWLSAFCFYLRFKLPLAMAISFAGMLAFFSSTIAAGAPSWFEANVNVVVLGSGLITFAFAMQQDLNDPHRITLRSDNAFFLHLMAAPLIVHALISLATGGGGDTLETTPSGEIRQSVVMIAIIIGLALIALLIDRRAMLVAGIGTLGYAVWVIIAAAKLDVDLVFSLTLILIGVLILLIGIGWHAVRRELLGLMPGSLVQRLPPAIDSRSIPSQPAAPSH